VRDEDTGKSYGDRRPTIAFRCHFRKLSQYSNISLLPLLPRGLLSCFFLFLLRVSPFSPHSLPHPRVGVIHSRSSISSLIGYPIYIYPSSTTYTMAPTYAGLSGRPLSLTVSTIATMGFLYVSNSNYPGFTSSGEHI